MKKNLFKTKLLLIAGFIPLISLSQVTSTGNPPANNTNAQADAAWYRGGNNNLSPLNNNIFGTLWNSPIYTKTQNQFRTKLNGTFIGGAQYAINGFVAPQVNTSGYFLLGVDYGVGATSFYNTRGAFSLLHLNGNSTGTAAFVQDGGYRPWMKTGITFTDNNDRAYIGYKANAPDESDFIINWSDNSVGGVGSAGPDNLIFNFTAADGSNATGIDGNQPNGREVVRMTGYGNVGIGPRFKNTVYRSLN